MFERPTAAKIRPQLASAANKAVLTSGELDERYTEAAGSAQMAKDNIVVTIEIGNNDTQESVWTTDLSYKYIKINAEYRTCVIITDFNSNHNIVLCHLGTTCCFGVALI
jgi:hypothetical protein